jgi:glycosyltransferase involved in cell wall biosynthesis
MLARYSVVLPSRQFDFVIPFTPWPSLVACLFREKFGTNRIFWNHRGGYDSAGFNYNSFLKDLVRRNASAFVANSQIGASFVEDTFGLAGGTTLVVRNFLESDVADSLCKEVTRRGRTGPINVLHVANAYPEKDLFTPVDAVAIARTRGVNCKLHMVGKLADGDIERRLRNRIATQNLEECVQLYDALDRAPLHQLIASSDVGLLSSRSEGMPNCVMEFMAARLPVVATNVPGIRELVGEDGLRWLFSVGNAEELSERLCSLASSPDLRRKAGESNQRRIRDEFSTERSLAQWLRAMDAASSEKSAIMVDKQE